MVAPKKEEPITTDAPGSEALPRVSTKHVFRECARLSPAILAHFLPPTLAAQVYPTT